MEKKLKGKAMYDMKGDSWKKRCKEYDQAYEFLMKLMPLIVIGMLMIIIWFGYKIEKDR